MTAKKQGVKGTSAMPTSNSTGEHVWFFMGPQDEIDFFRLVLDSGDILIRYWLSPDGLLQTVGPDPQKVPDARLCIARTDSRLATPVGTLCIDDYESEVISFKRSIVSHCDQPTLQAGRLSVRMNYWDRWGNIQVKPIWLGDRFQFYKRWLMRSYRPSQDPGLRFFIGPQAYNFYLNGTKMVRSGSPDPPRF